MCPIALVTQRYSRYITCRCETDGLDDDSVENLDVRNMGTVVEEALWVNPWSERRRLAREGREGGHTFAASP